MQMRTTDRAFPLLMKQLELMLTSGELNPRHQHTVTLYAKADLKPTPSAPVVTFIWLFIRRPKRKRKPPE